MSSSENDSEDVNLLEEAKRTILDLLNEIEEIIELNDIEQGELALVKLIFTRMNDETIMKQIVTKVLPFKTEIDTRNKNFFINHNTLFSSLPGQRVKHYRHILTDDDRLDDEDREIIWQYFDTFIWLGEQYKKNV